MEIYWYAVMKDKNDDDWGTGFYDKDEAIKLCRDWKNDGYVDAYICVVDNQNISPICVDTIEID